MNLQEIGIQLGIGLLSLIALYIGLSFLWNRKIRINRLSKGTPTPTFSNITKRASRFNFKEDRTPVGKTPIKRPHIYLATIFTVIALIVIKQYIVAGAITLMVVTYSSMRTKRVFRQRNIILDRMFQVANSNIRYPKEASLNPWGYVNIKNWIGLERPGETVITFPPSFRVDSPAARESFEQHLNSAVSLDNTWVYQWEPAKGLIVCKPVNNIPELAPYPGSEKRSWDEIPMGVGAEGEVIWRVSEAPHILVCGTTGGGKSVAQRTVIFHCIQHSDSWRFLGVDLKKVELSPYSKYDDVVLGIATEIEDAIEVLRYAKEVMMSRYEEMQSAGVQNFVNLPNKPVALMVMIDEAYELMSPGGVKNDEGKREDELKAEAVMLIGRIARLGRAAGIHLLIATQRPDAKVIYGEIKENLAVRYAAGRMKSTASSMVLDSGAATRIPGHIKGRAVISINSAETFLQGYFAETGWIDEWLKKNRSSKSENQRMEIAPPSNLSDGEISERFPAAELEDLQEMEDFARSAKEELIDNTGDMSYESSISREPETQPLTNPSSISDLEEYNSGDYINPMEISQSLRSTQGPNESPFGDNQNSTPYNRIAPKENHPAQQPPPGFEDRSEHKEETLEIEEEVELDETFGIPKLKFKDPEEKDKPIVWDDVMDDIHNIINLYQTTKADESNTNSSPVSSVEPEGFGQYVSNVKQEPGSIQNSNPTEELINDFSNNEGHVGDSESQLPHSGDLNSELAEYLPPILEQEAFLTSSPAVTKTSELPEPVSLPVSSKPREPLNLPEATRPQSLTLPESTGLPEPKQRDESYELGLPAPTRPELPSQLENSTPSRSALPEPTYEPGLPEPVGLPVSSKPREPLNLPEATRPQSLTLPQPSSLPTPLRSPTLDPEEYNKPQEDSFIPQNIKLAPANPSDQ